MGSLNFKCPLPAVIPSITQPECPEKFGQIQRLAFRLVQDPADATPTFATIADLIDKTKWTAALAAVDDKKIVITPFISGFVIPPGTPITEEGNNNNTVNGISLLQGFTNAIITGRFLNLPTVIADQLRALTPWSAITPGFTKLEVFAFTEFGTILYSMQKDTVKPNGFDVYNFVVPSVGTEGLVKPNVHNMQVEMLGNWDTKLGVADPSTAVAPWNPLQL